MKKVVLLFGLLAGLWAARDVDLDKLLELDVDDVEGDLDAWVGDTAQSAVSHLEKLPAYQRLVGAKVDAISGTGDGGTGDVQFTLGANGDVIAMPNGNADARTKRASSDNPLTEWYVEETGAREARERRNAAWRGAD